MRLREVSRRQSLDASLGGSSLKDGMKKLVCHCFEADSDRATVGSMREADNERSYVLLSLLEKEVHPQSPDLVSPPALDVADCEQRRKQARGPISPRQFEPKKSTEYPSYSMGDLFAEPSPPAPADVSSKYSSIRSSPSRSENSHSMSTRSSRRGRLTGCDSLDDSEPSSSHRIIPSPNRGIGERNVVHPEIHEDRTDGDEFALSAKASISYLLQQKDMKDGTPVIPPEKDRKYNEPAPFRKSPPPMHSFEKHPFSKPQAQDGRNRKISTVHLLRNENHSPDSADDEAEEELSPEELEEYYGVNRVIRKLKKQLDPLNYTDFWFTAEQVEGALDFSNSVRRCIAQTGTFGHETERLDRWLHMMILEAREGPHRLEFQLVKYAHLDKMIEEIVEFKSKPPTLPFNQLQMVERASDLLRYWRHRFGNRYYLLDRHRQKIVMDTLLANLGFKTPTPTTPTGWVPLSAIWMSEREAESEFEEGQWWVNLAAAHRDGIIGTQLEKPTKGKFGYTAIPLMTGKEEDVEADKVTYVREEKQQRKVPSLGDVSMLSLLGAKVRLLRGAGLQSVYAPTAGVRYDGVWIVKQYGHRAIPGTGMRRLTLRLERSSPKRPMSELATIPTPATVDYYRLFETMDALLRERAVTAYSYLEWHQRRARLKRAREQWHRLRVFREGVEFRRQRDLEIAAKETATSRRNVRGRVSSKIREKKASIKEEVREARKRSKVLPNVTATETSQVVVSMPDNKIYPGTWERKTMMSPV
ncbi:hypothetical protein GE09DRAFT_1217732 [Coniochaeta sp. 2T2.1]|nr:hypothetical protein GE09DRAFT_1217732 [Coniochaeta sp. 2T2.1]